MMSAHSDGPSGGVRQTHGSTVENGAGSVAVAVGVTVAVASASAVQVATCAVTVPDVASRAAVAVMRAASIVAVVTGRGVRVGSCASAESM